MQRDIHTKLDLLELEEQHDFETLLQKRVPNVLPFADTREQEIVVLLEDVLHKLRTWQESLSERASNQFEREATLIQQITKR